MLKQNKMCARRSNKAASGACAGHAPREGPRAGQALPRAGSYRAGRVLRRHRGRVRRAPSRSMQKLGAPRTAARAFASSASRTRSTTRTTRGFWTTLPLWNRWRHFTYEDDPEAEKEFLDELPKTETSKAVDSSVASAQKAAPAIKDYFEVVSTGTPMKQHVTRKCALCFSHLSSALFAFAFSLNRSTLHSHLDAGRRPAFSCT